MSASPAYSDHAGSAQEHEWRVKARAAGVDLARLPRHLGVIMDGNGRWAAARKLPRSVGHKTGVEAVRRLVRAAGEIGIPVLTLYSFSSENWKRPAEEVSGLMSLLRLYIRSDLDKLAENGVQVRIIGRRDNLDPDIRKLVETAEKKTAEQDKLLLNIAFNYGGRDDIMRGVQALARAVASGRLAPEEIDEAMVSAALDTGGSADPDMILRTSGEQRLSNFLIWQSAYAELVFQDVLWPDFSGTDLIAALLDFQKRERRYGGRCEADAPTSGRL